MILDKNKLIIFGYPRAGTKLLASIIESFGYHNYGEWYDIWMSKINNNLLERYSSQESIDIAADKNRPNYEKVKRVISLTNRERIISVNCRVFFRRTAVHYKSQ